LLELAPEVADRVEKREIEMGHARALLALSNRKHQVEISVLTSRKACRFEILKALVRRMQQSPASRVEEAHRAIPRESPGAGGWREARREGCHPTFDRR